GTGAAASPPNVWVSTVFIVVSGIGSGIAVVCNALLVQRGAPDRLRGRVFTVLMSSNYAVLGLGMIVAGALTNEDGARRGVWGLALCLPGRAAIAAKARPGGLRNKRVGEVKGVAEPI